jgi:hypothetical protein
MVTIFTNPRPFKGPFEIIQRNAIKSWLKLKPECQIVLFEDEEKTVSKIAGEFGVQCVTQVKRDEFGTPLLSDVFDRVRKITKGGIIAQVNADIILTNSFVKAVEQVSEITGGKPFFMTGRRWDLDIKEPIDFRGDWEKNLRYLIKKEGKLHGFSGMDYWVLLSDCPFDIPPFVVGRPGMDSWLVYKFRSLKFPVIDATAVVDIIHQNHNYPKKNNPFFEVEKKRNLDLAGGFSNMGTLRDADRVLTPEGLQKPNFTRRIFSGLTLFYPWRFLLLLKRKWLRIFG